ncbi:uncharacterized protein LOC125523554 isoform X1 [Triticum urartu]|uniref:uncharacterized protein LOC125523554 isoform X1 n=1 Tax=Triticum urartu TaxID=4572 RepID=UPI002044463E|nr:uncharacterized protein LOC125523554 isoform X1 [Triticum urartu]
MGKFDDGLLGTKGDEGWVAWTSGLLRGAVAWVKPAAKARNPHNEVHRPDRQRVEPTAQAKTDKKSEDTTNTAGCSCTRCSYCKKKDPTSRQQQQHKPSPAQQQKPAKKVKTVA